MEATLQLFAADTLEPCRGDCPRCGADVLAVELDGREVVVDVSEVLESFRCPNCAQVAARGHRRSGCVRCGGTGWIGEALPLRGVLVDDVGHARLYRRGRKRTEGEAVYVFHVCVASEV